MFVLRSGFAACCTAAGPAARPLLCAVYASTAAPTTVSVASASVPFAGGDMPVTADCTLTGPREGRMPCYSVSDQAGQRWPEAQVPFPLSQEQAVAMYRNMVKTFTADTLFNAAQRQGRLSFYLTSFGEEAAITGSAAALDPTDMIFAQYREQAALLWRGFSLRDMADQCFSNRRESGLGRQMPIHYGSKELYWQTISSPLGTQLTHAVGAGYAYKLEGVQNVSVTYFGDGAASEGDFHAALNFASTLKCPTLFIVRNNGWAISTPVTEQYAGDGIAARAAGYGMSAIRVDGMDLEAVYNATRLAREHAIEHSEPVVVELIAYRAGHHSTSDDSSRYRASEEMAMWASRDPIARTQRWLQLRGWWDAEKEKELRRTLREEVLEVLDAAEQEPKPAVDTLFTDVYAELPWHLHEQQADTMELIRDHPELLPRGVAPVSS